MPSKTEEGVPEPVNEGISKAWLHAQRSKFGACALDLPFKRAAAITPRKAAGTTSAVASLPANVKAKLTALNDPTVVCLASLHALLQRYTSPNDGLYGVQGSDGPASICYLGASDETTSLSSLQAECDAALRVARPHASNCIALAGHMNGSMPRPMVHLTVSDDRPFKGAKNKAGQGILLVVDVSLRDGTITVTWDPLCLESSYIEKTPDHLLPLIASLCTDAPGGALATDYLSAAERQLLVRDCNQTEAPVPPGCTHNFLTAAAAESPAHPAVIYGDQTW